MNNTTSLIIGIKPRDEIKLDHVELARSEAYPKENLLPEDGLYIYLYQSGEQHVDKKRQDTDVIWSKNVYN